MNICFIDYEEFDNASVIIANADKPHNLNLTIYNDADFSEPNETIVISLSVGFAAEFSDADADSLQRKIFLDLPTTTISIVSSGEIYTSTIIYHRK